MYMRTIVIACVGSFSNFQFCQGGGIIAYSLTFSCRGLFNVRKMHTGPGPPSLSLLSEKARHSIHYRGLGGEFPRLLLLHASFNIPFHLTVHFIFFSFFHFDKKLSFLAMIRRWSDDVRAEHFISELPVPLTQT